MKTSKTLMKVLLPLAIILVTFLVVNPFSRAGLQVNNGVKIENKDDVAVKGQLIEISKSMNWGMMGMNGCMMGMNKRNAYYNTNVPLGIVTSDGVLYCPLFFDTNEGIDNIKDYIGKQVEVTGTTYGNCMMSGLRITSIKESE